MNKILLVMLGGSLGAGCRYGITLLAVRLAGTRFPWGTLAVNLGGCFLIGLVYGLVERGVGISPSVRLFFVTGFLGALTTFSTFGWETMNAGMVGNYPAAAGNFLANNLGGLALVVAGYQVAKWFLQTAQ